MEVKEFRIGNFLTYQSAANTDEIFEVTVGSLYRIEENNCEGYDPIPLTKQWFIKCGGKDYGEGLCLHLDDCRLIWDDGLICICPNNGDGNFGVKCEYVHQLQNLYFALTGQELTIT